LAASVAWAVWNHSAHRFDRVQEAAYSLVKACALRQVVKGPHKGLWPRPCRSSQSDWQVGLTPESVNHELIFQQISPLAEPATQSMTPSSYEKSGCTLMPNSNDAASNEMLWERVLSLLVVGASMLGGSAVLLMQALPPILHEFP
jgi:hypothetical protein